MVGVMPGARVLVTGGTGFLGSHVVGALLNAGYVPRVMDLSAPAHPLDGAEYITGDIGDAAAVAAAMDECEAVYHFAGLADIDEAKDKPVQTAETNVLGTVRMLDAAAQKGVKRFMFASTVYVFSNSGSFYRASKQACEHFIECFHERYGLPFTVLRYGSLYGRGADSRNSIYRMVREALESGSITYRGSGDAVREYIHVDDAARLSVEALGERYANRHLLLTGAERLRVRELMQMIGEIAPGNVDLRFDKESKYSHYVITPYNYTPKIGHKLVLRDFVDLGQGILDCFSEISKDLQPDLHAEDTGNG